MPDAISSDLEQFVEGEIASGRYKSREAVIAHGLRLLQRDREEALEGIRLGLADVAAGRLHSVSDAFDDLRRELHVDKDA
jgi:putative addiction module CopG family antidote